MANRTLSFLLLLSLFSLVISSSFSFYFETEEPELQSCQRQCRQQRRYGEGEERECERRCEEHARERSERSQRREDDWRREEEEERESHRGERSPYFFDHESFQHRVRSAHGSVRVLERFTKRSELLRGIEKYRLGFLEANPSAFILPHHLDADVIFYVIQGDPMAQKSSP